MFNISKCQITRPDFQFGVPKKHKVATQRISYKRYREILFQKVALCYLSHFVQDGSSKNTLEHVRLRKNVKNTEIRGGKHINPPSLPLEGPYLPLGQLAHLRKKTATSVQSGTVLANGPGLRASKRPGQANCLWASKRRKCCVWFSKQLQL